MNTSPVNTKFLREGEPVGTLVASFGGEAGQLSASAGEQAGIAVDGATGDIYVVKPRERQGLRVRRATRRR